MNCNHDLDLLILLQADELAGPQAAAVQAQVDSCPSCREELARIEHVAVAVETPQLDPHAVASARALAYTRIGFSWRVRSRALMASIGEAMRRLRPMPELALAVLLVAVGYSLGSRSAGTTVPGAPESLAEVRDIELNEALGQAIVSVDPSGRSLTGNLSDAGVAELIQVALLRGDDNGIRNQALKTVRALAGSGAPQSDLTDAIIDLVQFEQQEALRLRAIWALDALYKSAELPTPARQALLTALTSDAGDGVRIAALNTLMAHQPAAEDAGTLRTVMSNDTNPYVRSGAAQTLERIGLPLEQLD